jgi:tetratricopeptide (TPR) repeat protein
MKLLATTALVLSLAGAGIALAQDDAAQQQALTHNAAYNAAMEAGDFDTAMTEAEAAWRAAEQGWGEDPNTAELAMLVAVGYLDLGQPQAAREAAARALELAPHAQSYTEGDARLWRGMSIVGDPAAQGDLEAGLAALDAAGTISEDTVRARMMVAAMQLGQDPAASVAMAQKAVEDARAIESLNLRAHLFEFGKMQYLGGQFGPATFSLRESLGYWEEQEVGVLPQPLADTLAWHTMADAAVSASAPAGAPAGPGGAGFGGGFPGMGFTFVPERNCRIEWAETPPVAFPPKAGQQANLGASVLLYDIAEDGSITNPRIAGAAPTRQYEQLILDGMRTWRVENEVRENCRNGHIQTVHYFY